MSYYSPYKPYEYASRSYYDSPYWQNYDYSYGRRGIWVTEINF